MAKKKMKSTLLDSKKNLSDDKNQRNKIIREINNQMEYLWSNTVLKKWVHEQKIQIGDLIVVNNSFVLRKSISTTKNRKYLAFKVMNKNLTKYEKYVINWNTSLVGDFKRISSKSNEYPELLSITEEIELELKTIGKLLFTLIGKKTEEPPSEENISHSQIKRIVWNSNESNLVQINDGTITISNPYDNDLWDHIKIELDDIDIDLSQNKLHENIEKALLKIKQKATTIIEIPKRGENISDNFLSDFNKFLENELKEYLNILNRNSNEINDLLRISYNFIDDALSLYRLICSICDLKPLVLWGTIFEHFSHNQTLMKIPGLIPGTKVDLKQYEDMIRQARNNKFHRMINFKRTLLINLPDDAIINPQLKIFSEYRNKKSNKFTYQDQALVDLLMGFTRTTELTLTEKFWGKNYDVMSSTLTIFKRTENLLKIILNEQTS